MHYFYNFKWTSFNIFNIFDGSFGFGYVWFLILFWILFWRLAEFSGNADFFQFTMFLFEALARIEVRFRDWDLSRLIFPILGYDSSISDSRFHRQWLFLWILFRGLKEFLENIKISIFNAFIAKFIFDFANQIVDYATLNVTENQNNLSKVSDIDKITPI